MLSPRGRQEPEIKLRSPRGRQEPELKFNHDGGLKIHLL